jgi:hypothetical protein
MEEKFQIILDAILDTFRGAQEQTQADFALCGPSK